VIWQHLLGHASPVTTARYAHLTDVTEKNSSLTINPLINSIHVDLEKYGNSLLPSQWQAIHAMQR